MERPNTVTGLAAHLVRTRWQALSPRGRVAATLVAGAMALGGVSAARMAMGGCCASSCASMRAAHEAAMVHEVPAADLSASAGATECPHAH